MNGRQHLNQLRQIKSLTLDSPAKVIAGECKYKGMV